MRLRLHAGKVKRKRRKKKSLSSLMISGRPARRVGVTTASLRHVRSARVGTFTPPARACPPGHHSTTCGFCPASVPRRRRPRVAAISPAWSPGWMMQLSVPRFQLATVAAYVFGVQDRSVASLHNYVSCASSCEIWRRRSRASLCLFFLWRRRIFFS